MLRLRPPAAVSALTCRSIGRPRWQSMNAGCGRSSEARVGEPQAVDEVMQEVSLAAVRGQAPISDRSKITPWLYQLAVRQSLLYRRKVGRRRKLVGNYVDRFHPTEQDNRTTDPLDWLLAEERQRLVRQCVARLVPRDSEISVAEIHRRLELSRTGGTLGRERKRGGGDDCTEPGLVCVNNWRCSM